MNEGVFSISELRVMREAFDRVVEQGCASRDEAARLVMRTAAELGCSNAYAISEHVQLMLSEGGSRELA